MKQWSDSTFVGGHPSLDFLNTVADQGKTRDHSEIADWESFAAWAGASGLFTASELRTLKALDGSGVHAAVLTDVHRLRETAHAVLSKLAAAVPPPRRRLAELEAGLSDALGRASLRRRDAGFVWSAGTTGATRIVDALALSLEDFLRGGDVSRLRECGRCTWLFIDRGRGKGRRWCDMRTCGNRAKAEAFRSR